MTNIYHGIWKIESTGDVFTFPIIQNDGIWLRVTGSRSYAPILPRLGNGAAFEKYEWQGDPETAQYATRPPIPTPDEAENPAEKCFGKWPVLDALRAMRREPSEAYDLLLRTDSDFSAAIDFALANHVTLPAERATETPRATGHASLSPSESAHIDRVTRTRGWSGAKSHSLLVDKNGLWRDTGPFARHGGYLNCVCRECGKKWRIGLSSFVHDQPNCDCAASADYSPDGRKAE